MKNYFYFILFIMFCANQYSFAQKTSTQSGNWSTGSTWGGTAPSSTDEVVIASGHTVTVTANATCCNYYVQSGATLTINTGITLTCAPTSCTNVGISAANAYDNKGTISGAGTFYINTSNSAGSTPNYENNGTISVTNLTLNNGMTAASFEDISFVNGMDAAGTITSTNLIIRNTSGNDVYFYNGQNFSSTVNCTNITVENLNTSWDSWIGLENDAGTVTGTTVNLNNSYTSDARAYLDNYGTMTLGNITTSTSSGNMLFYYGNNGATLNYSGASVHSSVRMDVDDATNTVNLNSTSATQAIPIPKNYSSGATSNYYNLTLNNTYTTYPQFTMAGNISVYNALTLTSGVTNMNSNRLTLGNPAGTSGTLTRTSGHFYTGTFRRYFTSGSSPVIGTDAGLFPLGSSYFAPGSTTFYSPFWIGATNITTSTDLYMDVSYTFTLPPTYTAASHSDATWSGGTTLQGVSNSYWTASRTWVTSARAIRFGGTGFGAATLTDLNAGQAASSAVGTFSAATNSVVAVEVNRTLSSSPSIDNDWYIGTKNKTQSTLPIELLEFTADPNGKAVDLKWETAHEVNNDYFTIERSDEGFSFSPIGQVKGAGNSNGALSYVESDHQPLHGLSYYRLKQTDFDGNYSYSQIVPVNFDEGFNVNIFPNPSDGKHGNIILSAKEGEVIHVEIVNMLGQTIYNKSIEMGSSHFISFPIGQFSEFSRGAYTIKASTKTNLISRKLVVQ